MNQPQTGLVRLAPLAVRLAALWLLAGALAKLFLGTPKDLPDPVRHLSPFAWGTTFYLVIAVELTLVTLAALRPKLAWLPLVALFVFFEGLLIYLSSLGAESCGCMGATITIPPWVMMTIDGVLLAFVIVTQPWRAFGAERSSRTGVVLLAAGIAVAWIAPWIVIGGTTPPVPPVASGTKSPDAAAPRWIEFDLTSWQGRAIHDVAEFTHWVPPESIPTDGKIVFWRQGCDHCAKHLREMSNGDDGSQPVLLVQARDDLKATRAVDAMPQGAHVTSVALPENVECAFTTPVELRVAGGTVTAVLFEKDFEGAAATKE